jgi:MFS family permease
VSLQAAASGSRRWWVAGLLTACFSLSYIDRQVVSILVAPIKAALNLSDTKVGLLQGLSFSLIYVAASLPLARIADRGNRTRLIGMSIAVWSVMTMLCGFARSFPLLLAARMGVAGGEAGLPPAALTMMADMFTPRDLVRATAVFNLAPFIGGGVALLAGGSLYALTAHWAMPHVPFFGTPQRWQFMFLMVGAPGLILAAVVASIRDAERRRAPGGKGNPFSDMLLFVRGNPVVVSFYMLSIALVAMLLNSYIAWFPSSMIRSQGMDERAVGLAFGPVFLASGALGTLFGGLVIGRMQDKVVERTFKYMRMSMCILLPIAIVAPMLPLLSLELPAVGAALFLVSSILGLSSIPLQYIAPPHLRAQAIALISIFSALLGIGMGPVVVGMLSDVLPFKTHSLSWALAIVGTVVVPTVIVMMSVVIRAHRSRVRHEAAAVATSLAS